MKGETILCISTRRWNSLWRSTQQIMSRMARQNRVLYFEPGRDPDRPHMAEMWHNLPNFVRPSAETLQDNLIVIQTPSCLPIMRQSLPRSVLKGTVPWTIKINARILKQHVRRAVSTFHVDAPILWLYSPSHVDLMGECGEKLTCFFVYDEFADFLHNGRIKEVLRQLDNRLSSQADVVFACSPLLYERRKNLNPNTHLILNAVDFDRFNRVLTADIPLPPDIAAVPKPIIGFTGWLGYHIDVELLQQVAETYSGCSLVLIGPDRLPDDSGSRQLRARPNVFFMGEKERHELPSYLQAFDVALLPYLLIEQIRPAYPLKLHEYLAAGLPVVTVDLPELQRHSNVVRLCRTNGEFLEQIGQALSDHSPAAIEARVAVAQENTWDQRVMEMYRVLDRQLATRDGMMGAANGQGGKSPARRETARS